MKAGRRAEAGMILLEVMLAVTILGIALFSILQALTTSVSSAAAVRNYAVADRLLENLVNELRYPPLDEQEAGEPLLVEGFIEGDFGDEYPGFRWERERIATDAPGLYEVRYSVFWPGRRGEREETVWSYEFDAAEASQAAALGGEADAGRPPPGGTSR